jgi:hypothetical protein
MPISTYGPYTVCTGEVQTAAMIGTGDQVTVRASGDVDFGSGWALGVGAPVEGPAGPSSGEKAVSPYPGVGLVKNSLLVKIGSSLFQGGFSTTLNYTGSPALLSLLPNDDRPTDNSRGWTVFVDHTTPTPPPPPVPLQISAIEVVQAIQRVDNSVQRAAGHRTVVRAFVKSNGSTPISNVSGKAFFTSINPAGIWSQGTATPLNAPVVASTTPSRDQVNDSLNFEVPIGLVRDVLRVEVHAWVGTPPPSWDVSLSCGVDFEVRRPQELLPLLVTDTFTTGPVPPTPTMANFLTSMGGAVDRYPLADPSFSAPGFSLSPSRVMTYSGDLSTQKGFNDLLADVTNMIFTFSGTTTGTRAALIANDTRYAFNGVATIGHFLNALSFVAQAGLQGTFAHELGHTHGLHHAPRCTSSADDIDPRLPAGTENVGYHVASNTLIEQNRGEIMSYSGDTSRCPGSTRWPSIVTWELLYDEFN